MATLRKMHRHRIFLVDCRIAKALNLSGLKSGENEIIKSFFIDFQLEQLCLEDMTKINTSVNFR